MDGSGSASFTADDLAAGNHDVDLGISNTPSPGSTYYVNEACTRNAGIGTSFAGLPDLPGPRSRAPGRRAVAPRVRYPVRMRAVRLLLT
jgi:hypothetical protein